MTDPEFQLRELMKIDAQVYRFRNQIMDRTDPKPNKKVRAILKAVKADPTEEPPP